MKTESIIFDIETGPLPEWELVHIIPDFEGKTGTKDPEKIAVQIEEKKQKWMEEAALHADRGQVIAIGFMFDGDFFYHTNKDGERALLTNFWDEIQYEGAITQKIVGFNSNRFDIPFLIRRSWKLGVAIPPTLFRGRYLSDWFVDLMELWQCGDRQATISLDRLSKHFGYKGKTGSGKFFYQLWEDDQEAAIDYLANDLLLTQQCARAMGVIE
jgi:predicted PolB exonuclease-like 3'-5' exonuclease